MIRAYVAAAALLAGLSFWAGWEWRDRSADLAISKQALKQAQAETKAVESARTAEREQADKLAAIGAKHEEDRAAAPSVADAVVAGVRSGDIRLRDGWASCETQRLSEASAAAIERDAATERRAEFAAAVVRVGAEADSQLAACQAVVLTYAGQ